MRHGVGFLKPRRDGSGAPSIVSTAPVDKVAPTPWHRLARYPLSICTVTIVGALGLWTTGRPHRVTDLKQMFGFGWSDLVSLRLYRLPTAIFIQTQPGVRGTIGLLLIIIPIAEWRLGSRLATNVLFLGDWVSTVLVLCGLRLFAATGRSWAMVEAVSRDGGTSSAVHALAAASVLTIRTKRTRQILGAMIALEVLGLLALRPQLYDVQHGLAALTGWALGSCFLRTDRR